MIRRCYTAIATLWLIACSGAPADSISWLRYEPAIVQLTGVLEVVQEYGPPNWGDDPLNDEKLRVPVLRLSEPVNISGDSHSDINTESFENVREVQLQLDGYDSLVGKRVTVSGTLFAGHTGWHFKSVVMSVKVIQPIR